MNSGRGSEGVTSYLGLSFKTKASLCQPIEPAPYEAIDRHNGGRHHHGGCEQQIEVPLIRCLGDGGSQSGGGVDLPLEVKILGHDAGVPSASRSRHQACDEIGKNSWQNQLPPALQSLQVKYLAAF